MCHLKDILILDVHNKTFSASSLIKVKECQAASMCKIYVWYTAKVMAYTALKSTML